MSLRTFFIIALGISLIAACSRESKDERLTTHIHGQVTVDQDLDDSGDHSGIELLVAFHNPDGEARDTIFHAVTDSDGYFSGTARFTERDIYPVVISRNRNTFGVQNMIFADGDTITFNAEIPNVAGTATISSKENDVYRTLERVERNFNRVAQFINAGAISPDSIEIELAKWSDIYWEVHENYPGTYASMMAGNTSVSLASGWNDSLMIERMEKLLEKESHLRSSSRSALIDYYAEVGGVDEVLRFLERLERRADTENNRMNVQIDRIEFLYDSSRTMEANRYLDEFRNYYADNRAAMEWADGVRYDLEFLSPGSEFPSFQFLTIDGDTISNESLEGRPYLIEITRLENPLYQQQFDRTVAINQIYNTFGLEIITVSLTTNQVIFNAFFEDRGVMWNIVQPGSFDADEVIQLLNVNQVPTRFLVNDRGELIRRYVGNEYDEVVRGLQQMITQNDEPL
jgi:hypothetical protein